MKYAHVRVKPHVGALLNGRRSSRQQFLGLVRRVTFKPLTVALTFGMLSSGFVAVGSSTAGASSVYKAPSFPRVAAAVKELPKAIEKSGVIHIAMVTNQPPGSYYAAGTKTLVGMDPSIAELLAQALGLKPVWAVTSFTEIIPGISAGRYQVTVSEMAPEISREKLLDFVDYAQTGDALAVVKGNPNHVNINKLCGVTVGAMAGSYQVTEVLPAYEKACAKAGKPAISLKLYPDESSPILALAAGRIEAVYEDSPVLDYAATQTSAIEIQTNRNFGPVAVGMGKTLGLEKAIHTAMTAILHSSQYKAVLAHWGLSSVAIKTAKVNDNG